MGQDSVVHTGRRSQYAALAVLMALLAFGSGLSSPTAAQERARGTAATETAAPADLEKAFWVCDYIGTNGSVDPAMAVACVTLTEQFKNARFNGDFDAMLAYWRENKPTVHQALERASRRGEGVASATLPLR